MWISDSVWSERPRRRYYQLEEVSGVVRGRKRERENQGKGKMCLLHTSYCYPRLPSYCLLRCCRPPPPLHPFQLYHPDTHQTLHTFVYRSLPILSRRFSGPSASTSTRWIPQSRNECTFEGSMNQYKIKPS